ncbi:hypothetical protein HA48_14610 [Pantoea wallisii]|uniref:Uncharacterized protein n=1 Tax=Pantoea wallisii TaxID=1076551 RepID=A0A1X1D6W5_9GAMM|nr:hypothetical protein [Pantoea wallisii]ORM72386.1 hypothetical protein HA48_14610 [Pantoea wallisii]
MNRMTLEMEKLHAIANGDDFKKRYLKIKNYHKNHFPEYLKEKWLHLRMYKRKDGFAVDYRLLKRTAKMIGAHYAGTRA